MPHNKKGRGNGDSIVHCAVCEVYDTPGLCSEFPMLNLVHQYRVISQGTRQNLTERQRCLRMNDKSWMTLGSIKRNGILSSTDGRCCNIMGDLRLAIRRGNMGQDTGDFYSYQSRTVGREGGVE